MKAPIMLLFLIVGNLILSIAAMGNPTSPVTYYLNQKPVDLKRVFLEVGTVDSITVDKSGGVGVVKITTKNNEFHFYRLSDILKKHPIVEEADNLLVFRINDRLIPDTAGVKIDTAYRVVVNIQRFFNIEYIPAPYRRITLVDINLKKEKAAQATDISADRRTKDLGLIIRNFMERINRRSINQINMSISFRGKQVD